MAVEWYTSQEMDEQPYNDALLDFLSNYVMFFYRDDRMHYFRPIILVVCTYLEILTLYGLWEILISGDSTEIAFAWTTTFTQQFVTITALLSVFYYGFEGSHYMKRFMKTSIDFPITDEEGRRQMQYKRRVLISLGSILTTMTFVHTAAGMPQFSTSRLIYPSLSVIYKKNNRLSFILNFLNIICVPLLVYTFLHPLAQLVYFFHYDLSLWDIRQAKIISKIKNEQDEDAIFNSLKELTDLVLYIARDLHISNLHTSRYFGMAIPIGFLISVGFLYSFIVTDRLLEKLHILCAGFIVAFELVFVTYTGQAISEKITRYSNDLYNLEWYNWKKKNTDALRLTLLYLNQSNVLVLNFYGLLKYDFPLVLKISQHVLIKKQSSSIPKLSKGANQFNHFNMYSDLQRLAQTFAKLCYTVLTLALNLRNK